MSAGARIRLEGLRLAFGDMPAADVDLDVEPGEIVVLLGPSGCGKSTILRALAGLLQPVAGRAEVAGKPVGGTDAPCAMVFQEDALLPWRSAVRNVEYALKLRGVPRGERRRQAEDLLAQVGLKGFSDHLPGQLSGGMRQRVQLARTLATRPRVMLMDEPFGALDAQTRSEMQQLLISVWQQYETTILFVTHDVDEALLLADRIVLLTPRPAKVAGVVDIPSPRRPGAQFEPEFTRRRYEILASMGETPASSTALSTDGA
ncbi:ABC transporter ATP-binding protein [Streptomyces sp. Li-HN-5-11]|uniref:ABC transporter ATP-binding protein n=1 Tax=Streptomyces sp. Li-HN-5-11 TaxID=3075432 RepID=UPI0028AA7B11|nr:ABC transporter ATP-binding protein [Streptomyces sp. Li-HN-5-11]WNM32547.1 ABC transporter ATP-binding protein [Streptomyces sp. Li-HN-5-11]WOP38703.1 ABC transporter ATP-binding protein [Streptomyces sp. Li-HN-5-13]